MAARRDSRMIWIEINDEKTSRGMEIIISSVPAKTHFLSKVLAALSYVLILFSQFLFYLIKWLLYKMRFV